MKIFLVIAIIIISLQYAQSQFAIIDDDDGFTNVRLQPNSNSEIIYKLSRDEVFLYDILKSQNEWIRIYINENKFNLDVCDQEYIIGYIHRSRLKPIESLQKYTDDEFKFEYELKPFSFSNKICDYNYGYISLVNGKRFYGTDGPTPKIEVANIIASLHGQNIEIAPILFQDLFECNDLITIYSIKDTYFVVQDNSDGAGYYGIIWVFKGNSLVQRLIFQP